MVHDPIRAMIALRKVLVVAVGTALVPIVLKKVRPLARTVGDGFVKIGEYLKEEPKTPAQPDNPSAPAEDSQSTATAAEAPEPPLSTEPDHAAKNGAKPKSAKPKPKKPKKQSEP